MAAKLRTGLLLYPDLTELDATAPYEVFARAPELEVLTIAKRKGPVRSEFGLTIAADTDLASTPQLDVILSQAAAASSMRRATPRPSHSFRRRRSKRAGSRRCAPAR